MHFQPIKAPNDQMFCWLRKVTVVKKSRCTASSSGGVGQAWLTAG
jgi:hypothetical protein